MRNGLRTDSFRRRPFRLQRAGFSRSFSDSRPATRSRRRGCGCGTSAYPDHREGSVAVRVAVVEEQFPVLEQPGVVETAPQVLDLLAPRPPTPKRGSPFRRASGAPILLRADVVGRQRIRRIGRQRVDAVRALVAGNGRQVRPLSKVPLPGVLHLRFASVVVVAEELVLVAYGDDLERFGEQNRVRIGAGDAESDGVVGVAARLGVGQECRRIGPYGDRSGVGPAGWSSSLRR